MIIFGTRGVKSTMNEGDFHCPQCATQKRFKHKKVTQFFTLYFIPLIPINRVGEYVECQDCRGTFVPKVLEYRQNASSDKFLAEYEKAITHSMVLIMLADGVIDENEKIMVQKIFNKFSHHDITLTELEAYIARVQRNPEDISTYLKRVTPSLNEHGKEILIKCAVSVAAADGHIDDSEIALINQMAKVLEMSSSHLKGILSEIMQPEKPHFSQN